MTCDEFEEISGAYALDAVTPAERQAAEAHLASCAKCTTLLQDLRGVVSLLPLSVPQIKPPPALEARILAAVRQEGQGDVVQRPQPIPIPITPLQARQRVRPRRWNPQVLVAAAVLMFSLLGGMVAWNISLHGQVATLQQQLTAATDTHATGVTSYAVKGTAQHQNATGQLVYFAAQNITVLIMHGLPQLQGTHVYQGWLMHLNGKNITGVTSVGLLNTQNGSATVSFAGNITGYDAAAISLEAGPTATPEAPKGGVVAIGSLKTSIH
jgi:anti-sigma-K factor RskA